MPHPDTTALEALSRDYSETPRRVLFVLGSGQSPAVEVFEAAAEQRSTSIDPEQLAEMAAGRRRLLTLCTPMQMIPVIVRSPSESTVPETRCELAPTQTLLDQEGGQGRLELISMQFLAAGEAHAWLSSRSPDKSLMAAVTQRREQRTPSRPARLRASAPEGSVGCRCRTPKSRDPVPADTWGMPDPAPSFSKRPTLNPWSSARASLNSPAWRPWPTARS